MGETTNRNGAKTELQHAQYPAGTMMRLLVVGDVIYPPNRIVTRLVPSDEGVLDRLAVIEQLTEMWHEKWG